MESGQRVRAEVDALLLDKLAGLRPREPDLALAQRRAVVPALPSATFQRGDIMPGDDQASTSIEQPDQHVEDVRVVARDLVDRHRHGSTKLPQPLQRRRLQRPHFRGQLWQLLPQAQAQRRPDHPCQGDRLAGKAPRIEAQADLAVPPGAAILPLPQYRRRATAVDRLDEEKRGRGIQCVQESMMKHRTLSLRGQMVGPIVAIDRRPDLTVTSILSYSITHRGRKCAPLQKLATIGPRTIQQERCRAAVLVTGPRKSGHRSTAGKEQRCGAPGCTMAS